MARSLSFIYLFVILTISYVGGALLCREWPAAALEQVVGLYDGRITKGSDASLWSPFLVTCSFIGLAVILSKYRKLRFLVLLIGALKCSLFGMSSTFLLSDGMKILLYSVWWFPFQLAGCVLFLMLCMVLNPPFFASPGLKKERPLTAVPMLIGLLLVIQLMELTIYHFMK